MFNKYLYVCKYHKMKGKKKKKRKERKNERKSKAFYNAKN